MSTWRDTVLSDEELMSWHFKPLENRQAIPSMIAELLNAQAERSFRAGQENERAKVKTILHKVKDANDLKELEDRIREYKEEK